MEPFYLNPTIKLIIRGLGQILIVALLVMGSVQLILATARLWIPIEYRMPGFPEDRYGFSLEDRLYWSSIDLDFLASDQGIEFFDEYQLKTGEPMHNERELDHFIDVKNILAILRKTFWGGLIFLAILLYVVGKTQGAESLGLILRTGSIWTIVVIGLLIIGLVFAFGVVFVGFHQIFFEGTTWIFKFSDTFIRLYPERFWRDVFALVLLVTVGGAGGLYFIARRVMVK
jgi:integral membrane protein (TIGR01906 family)